MSGMNWVDFLSLILIIFADFIIICSFSNYSEFSKMHHFEIQQLDISPHGFVLLTLNMVNT